MKNEKVIFSETASLARSTLAAIRASNGMWRFKMPYKKEVTILMPVYFTLSTPETVKSLGAREGNWRPYHPPITANDKEEMISNAVIMRPIIIYREIAIDYFPKEKVPKKDN